MRPAWFPFGVASFSTFFPHHYHLCLHGNRWSGLPPLTPLPQVYLWALGSSLFCLMLAIESPGLCFMLRGEQASDCLLWGCTRASIRMKVSCKEANILLSSKWAYKPHFMSGLSLVKCCGRATHARSKVFGIVLTNPKSLVKSFLMMLGLPDSFLSFR